jgi:uncharacterized protein (TIGR00369 family)
VTDREPDPGSTVDPGELLRAAFPETALHRLLGLRIVQSDAEKCVVQMPVREEAFNSSGNLHGGAIATLIDVAAGMAAARNSAFEPGTNTIVTADLHVRYLGRPRGDVVRAEAQVLRAGRQLVVVECRVVDPEDRVIASADFSSMVVPLREPLRPVEGADPATPDL